MRYRVYNNQPNECYGNTWATFKTEEKALLYIYTDYYYLIAKDITLDKDEILEHINEFTMDDVNQTLEALKAHDQEYLFFEDLDYECLG